MKIAIVVVGYNRAKSIMRLLERLQKCEYGNEKVDLFVSLDNSGSLDVLNEVKEFNWNYGKININHNEIRMGLRKHILQCGDIVKGYDGIVMFEDDIFPSKYFFQYAKQALEFYNQESRIAGISLYKHLWNFGVNEAFTCMQDEYDNYFQQFAQSWGQVWSKRMWQEFYKWYENNNSEFYECEYLPNYINNWPNTSWLKYFNKYIVENNKYFVYPKIALSTNFSEIGENNKIASYTYQVELQQVPIKKYKFSKLNESSLVYDIYFENEKLKEYIGKEVTIDLYGAKEKFNQYLLSSKEYNYKIEKKFALTMIPHEMNIIEEINGEGIYLYNTSISEERKKNKNIRRLLYSHKNINLRQIKSIYEFRLKEYIKFKIKKK